MPKNRPVAKKAPRTYQQKAIKAICSSFKRNDRCYSVMACGTGKTLVSLWVAERQKAKRIIIFCPSLFLIQQTLKEWANNTKWRKASFLAVCSDKTVTQNMDEIVLRPEECDFPVVSNQRQLTKYLSESFEGIQVILSTYQSSHIIAQSIKKNRPFDLGIFDEAHKTTGPSGSPFKLGLENKSIPIRKRLFMTATPKHYDILKKDKLGDAKLIYSMNDVNVYGPLAYHLSFREAINLGIICDYKIIVSLVTSDEVAKSMKGGSLARSHEVAAVKRAAAQIALQKSIKKYSIKKAITFHKTISEAKNFQNDLENKGPLKSFSICHVSGNMPTVELRQMLDEFKDSSNGLITNARCLTEGVDVPAVDLVAFLATKRSTIDIVQACGRTMRKARGKKCGYILLPLFFPNKGREKFNAENLVVDSDFVELWNVLNALQEQDEELAEIIRTLRQNIGEGKVLNKTELDKFISITGSQAKIRALKRSITVTTINKLTSSWDEMFGKLLTFKKHNGHFNIPANSYKNYSSLRQWCMVQRSFFRHGKISEARKARLTAIGFEFEPVNETNWNKRYQELIIYKKQFGNYDISSNDIKNRNLLSWILTQRKLYNSGELSDSRLRRLNEIGFIWNKITFNWETQFSALLRFKEKNGHCNVLTNTDLGKWLGDMRNRYKNGRLSNEQQKRLERLGVVWEVREKQWNNRIEQLISFKKRYGHYDVLASQGHRSLALWLSSQRRLYKQEKLSKPKIKELSSLLGAKWENPKELRWDKMYQALVKFKKQQSHCKVPGNVPKCRELHSWCRYQRDRYNKQKLTTDQIKKLNKLKFDWNLVETRWEKMFKDLKSYKNKFGHCNVQRKDDLVLYGWCRQQLKMKKEKQLDKERQKQLKAIGLL